jgi:hypothetical protein
VARNNSIHNRLPKNLKHIKYSALLTNESIKIEASNNDLTHLTSKLIESPRIVSRNATDLKLGKSVKALYDYFNTTSNFRPVKKAEPQPIKILTPKTKKGQVFFNNCFVKSITDSIENNFKRVTKDKMPNKVNVIDCLAMDNYERVYNNFNKYSQLLRKDRLNKVRSISINPSCSTLAEKSSLEDLYSRDFIISNKFIKTQDQIRFMKVLPPVKKIKREDEMKYKPKMHYIFKKISNNLKTSA